MALRVPPHRANRASQDDDFVIFKKDSSGRGRAGQNKGASELVRLSLYRKIGATFLALTVVLLVFVLYISFSRATVRIIPKTESVSHEPTFTVTLEPAGPGSLPGYVLETEAEGEKTIAAAGKSSRSVEGNACGTVTLINNQPRSQQLVVRTRLLSPEGVLFRLTKTVTVPANGSLDAEACADEPGKKGDIAATTFTIPGLAADLQKKTYASSSAAMAGGVRSVAVVGEEEVALAAKAFAEELAAKAVGELGAKVPSVEARSGVLTKTTILSSETDAKPGTEQSEYKLKLRVHVIGVFYDPIALGQAGAASLEGNIGASRVLLGVDRDSLTTSLVRVDPAKKEAVVKVRVAGNARIREDASVLDPSKLAGLSRAEAERYLTGLAFVERAEIKLRPAWARSMPTLIDHIDVVIAEPEEASKE